MNTPSRFGITPGRVLAREYRVDRMLGAGYEGEVYLVTERLTGASRAAKLFFPERNERDKAAMHYARKLEGLRDCDIVIQYHHTQKLRLRGCDVTMLVSEFVEGVILDDLVNAYPGARMQPFEAMCVLRSIAAGLAPVHERREYHGDIHSGNILVRRRGVHYDVKLVDMYDHGRATKAHIVDDMCNVIRVFYDLLGGQKFYAKHPQVAKSICCGLKRTLIEQRYPTAWHLCRYLDSVQW
ncbi:MAG: protein kinase [Phycisphaerales bacterium]